MSRRISNVSIVVALLLAASTASVAQENNGLDGFGEAGPTHKGVDVLFNPSARERKGLSAQNLPVTGAVTGSSEAEDLNNVQVNDPALDHIQTFPGTRPFEFSIQSETSVAAFGNDIVVGYNSSADSPVVQLGAGLFFTHVHFSGFSASHDGGRTWKSGFVPPVAGSPFTFGDPSVGVDRRGNFFYVSLGADATGTGAVIVNKSTDGGRTFAPAVVAALDDGSDKEWLAVGPDPFIRDRDNQYVAWTSFQVVTTNPLTFRSELRFVRSIDGGKTWSPQKVLFAPTDTGVMSAFIQFANPVVDASTGRLYIPFLHFSNLDEDFIKVLVSDDGGQTFRFLRFNVPGAPDPFGFANVTPGIRSDCGRPGGGIRLVLRQGANLGGGRFGLPRFRRSTRLITQPSAAAADGKIFIALNSSTSPVFGDPTANSEIRLLFSLNGGESWQAVTVVHANAIAPQHVHPAIVSDRKGERLQIAYYVQQADERLRVDLLRAKVEDRRVRVEDVQLLSSVAFDLIPSNNPIPTATLPFRTTNYDRIVVPCYNIGEYLSIFLKEDDVLGAWGDNRNSWTSPAGSPAAGTHAQPDVFFQGPDN